MNRAKLPLAVQNQDLDRRVRLYNFSGGADVAGADMGGGSAEGFGTISLPVW